MFTFIKGRHGTSCSLKGNPKRGWISCYTICKTKQKQGLDIFA